LGEQLHPPSEGGEGGFRVSGGPADAGGGRLSIREFASLARIPQPRSSVGNGDVSPRPEARLAWPRPWSGWDPRSEKALKRTYRAQKPRIRPETRSSLRVHSTCSASAAAIGGSRPSTGRDTCFLNIVGPYRTHGSSPDGGGGITSVGWSAGEWACQQLPGWARWRHSPRASGRLLRSSSGSGRPNGAKEAFWSWRGSELNAPLSVHNTLS
jgi:hypothetical protein